MTTQPTRSGTLVFVGKWHSIKAALNQRMKIEGQCPSQDIDQFAPGYEPGISRNAVMLDALVFTWMVLAVLTTISLVELPQ